MSMERLSYFSYFFDLSGVASLFIIAHFIQQRMTWRQLILLYSEDSRHC